MDHATLPYFKSTIMQIEFESKAKKVKGCHASYRSIGGVLLSLEYWACRLIYKFVMYGESDAKVTKPTVTFPAAQALIYRPAECLVTFEDVPAIGQQSHVKNIIFPTSV